MKITNNTTITKVGNLSTNDTVYQLGLDKSSKIVYPDNDLYDLASRIYNLIRTTNPTERPNLFNNTPGLQELFNEVFKHGNAPQDEQGDISKEKVCELALGKLMKFFTEFEFEPNFRFVNTFANKLAKSDKQAKDYIYNYFRLVDNNYAQEVVAKMKSPEWADICKDIKAVTPTNTINKRFKVYFGSAGTGKTTLAQKESDGRCVICNNSMLPSDIMEDFVFSNGQPTFQPSSFWTCMEQGLPITLDEINLLPFETLRFLQGLLDGKKEFLYKGRVVHIADGFEVIGTMNLVVNGAVFNLPEPLVDRASEMREFKLTAKQLLSAII